MLCDPGTRFEASVQDEEVHQAIVARCRIGNHAVGHLDLYNTWAMALMLPKHLNRLTLCCGFLNGHFNTLRNDLWSQPPHAVGTTHSSLRIRGQRMLCRTRTWFRSPAEHQILGILILSAHYQRIEIVAGIYPRGSISVQTGYTLSRTPDVRSAE